MLSRAVGAVFQRLLIRRYAVDWAWQEDWEPVDEWDRFEVDVDGTPLALAYAPAVGPTRGVVVCAPPTTRSAKGFFLGRGYTRALRAGGFGVVLFDLNGFGESPYRSIDYAADVLAAGREAERRAGGRPVGLLGVCFGGTYGLCALSHPGHPFRAAVFETPFDHLGRVLAELDGQVQTRAYRLGAGLVPFLKPFYRRYVPEIQAARAVGVERALFVAGGRDEVVDPASVRALADALRRSPARPDCEVWTLPEAEHLRAAVDFPDRLFDRALATFSAMADAPRPAELAEGAPGRI